MRGGVVSINNDSASTVAATAAAAAATAAGRPFAFLLPALTALPLALPLALLLCLLVLLLFPFFFLRAHNGHGIVEDVEGKTPDKLVLKGPVREAPVVFPVPVLVVAVPVPVPVPAPVPAAEAKTEAVAESGLTVDFVIGLAEGDQAGEGGFVTAEALHVLEGAEHVVCGRAVRVLSPGASQIVLV